MPPPQPSPSRWSRRLPVTAAALLGFAIALYLTLYQLDVVGRVWEPFFGQGSKVILRESSIAHLLPVPDASLGAALYLFEVVLSLLGGQERWRSSPWLVLLLGLAAGSMALGSLGLVACQPVLFHHFCTLCLASAGCSFLVAVLEWDEVRATLRYLRQESAAGRAVWQALREPGGEGRRPG